MGRQEAARHLRVRRRRLRLFEARARGDGLGALHARLSQKVHAVRLDDCRLRAQVQRHVCRGARMHLRVVGREGGHLQRELLPRAPTTQIVASLSPRRPKRRRPCAKAAAPSCKTRSTPTLAATTARRPTSPLLRCSRCSAARSRCRPQSSMGWSGSFLDRPWAATRLAWAVSHMRLRSIFASPNIP